jgi:hypothetical protein
MVEEEEEVDDDDGDVDDELLTKRSDFRNLYWLQNRIFDFALLFSSYIS